MKNNEEIFKLSSYFEKYNIDGVWKNINKKTPIIYECSYLKKVGNDLEIRINDNSVAMVLSQFMADIEAKLRLVFTDVDKIKLVTTTEKIDRSTSEKSFATVKQNNDSIQKARIIRQVKEKYSNVEDDFERKMYIAYETQIRLREYDQKKEGYVTCLKCQNSFKQVEDENECILCRNKEFERVLNRAKVKILEDPTMTEKMATQIYDISKKVYFQALASIEDEILKQMYQIIDNAIKEGKTKIELSSQMRRFSIINCRSKDEEILELKMKRLEKWFLNNIWKIYGCKVSII